MQKLPPGKWAVLESALKQQQNPHLARENLCPRAAWQGGISGQ
jgi:hypothetical protein